MTEEIRGLKIESELTLSAAIVLLYPCPLPHCPPLLVQRYCQVLEGLCVRLPTATGSDVAPGWIGSVAVIVLRL